MHVLNTINYMQSIIHTPILLIPQLYSNYIKLFVYTISTSTSNSFIKFFMHMQLLLASSYVGLSIVIDNVLSIYGLSNHDGITIRGS